MNTKYIYNKRIFTPSLFVRETTELFRKFGAIKYSFRRQGIDHRFRERIMLSATKVNGCRYCSYGHTKAALASGISQIEIDELMKSEYSNIPEYELKAILFAQHYAENLGKYDHIPWQNLIDNYGTDTVSDILASIRLIMIGNLCGNTLDALYFRMKGYTIPQSNFFKELLVILLMITYLPVIMIVALIIKKSEPIVL